MDKALYPYLLFWSIGLLFFMAESLYPARPIAYRSVLWRDLLALAAYNLSFLLGSMDGPYSNSRLSSCRSPQVTYSI